MTDVINGVPRDWLKQLHRDLDACQKLIWANLRGCDPAYCADAQARLAEIETMLATAQPADHSEHDLNMAAQPAADGDLDERMRAAGMLTVAELLKGAPLDAFVKHAGVNDLPSLQQWAEMKRGEYLRMQARYDLREKEKDDLYEWVIAHCAVFTELHVNIRAALPAKADGEREAFEAYCQTIGYTLKTGDSGHYLGGYGAEIWAGWKARAAQPQQAVAVTDEVRRLREALERVKLTEKEARHHSVSTVAYWNNAVTACISVLAAQGGEVGK